MRPKKQAVDTPPSFSLSVLVLVGCISLGLGWLLNRSPEDSAGKPEQTQTAVSAAPEAGKPPMTAEQELALGEHLSQHVCAA
jgi:hypothetical protein